MGLRTVGVKLVADVSAYTAGLRTAGGATKSFVGELNGAAKAGKLDSVADQAAGMGLVLAGVAGAAVKLSMDFEKSMSAVSAATHASTTDLNQLRDAAMKAGADTQYSATEAADAITELSKAGVGTADVLGGALDGALDLAAAGQLDVAEAAETAASAMTQFGLKGDKVPHIADLLAAAAGKAQGSVHDMGYALNQSGLVASQFGLSIEDTTGVLAEFASAGLIGSDAGTSFKTMLLAIANPSGVTAKKMQELGISFYDAQGQFIGLGGTADELRDKLGQLSEEERNAALGQIFGSDAIRAATILYKDGAKGVEEWKNKVDDSGYAAETAAKLTDNLSGDLERLQGSIETLAIQSGSGANSGLRVVAQAANAMVDQFGQLPGVISGSVTVVAGLTGALLLGGAAWIKMKRSNADALEELRNTGPAGEKAARGLQTTTKWAGRAAAAFAASQIAAAGVSAAFGDQMNPQVEALSQSLEAWASTGAKSGEAARLLGDDFEHLGYDIGTLDSGFWTGLGNGISGTVESFTGLGDVADESLTHAKERLTALDGALSQMVQNGKGAQAAEIFKKLAEEGKSTGVSVDELKKGLPQYTGAVQTAGSATATTADDVKDLGDEAETSSGAMMALSKSIDELFQVQMSADRAALKLADSTESLTKELTKGKRELSVNTDEGRKNRAAVLDQLEAIEAVRDARVRGGETIEKSNLLYQKDIEGLKKVMRQAGFTTKQIDSMTEAYEGIPGQVSTSIRTPGLPAARTGIKDYDKKLDALARTIKTDVSVTGQEKAYRQLKELLIMQQAAKKGISVSAATSAFNKNAGSYHDGGRTATVGEHEPAGVVHGDEYVIRKSSRQKIERSNPGLLDEMNATGQLPGYAGGGRVLRMPFPVNASGTMIPSPSAMGAGFGEWPSSPSAQRGDSGVWRKILAWLRAVGIPFTWGNGYRPGDPLWHGSGRADDLMGYEQDRLASFLATQRPLELIHRTKKRDYAYTRGVNKGSFNESLMNAHRNHVHIAMANGGVIREPVHGIGASGTSYSFGEGYRPERVTPLSGSGSSGSCDHTMTLALAGADREFANFLLKTMRTSPGVTVTMAKLLGSRAG